VDLIAYFQNARKKLLVPAGRALFEEGDAGAAMFVLIEGSASVHIRQTLVEIARPGTLLGEMSMIDSSPRSATVLARTECQFVSIDRREFDLLIRETPAFARHVMEIMAERLRGMNERMAAAAASKLVALQQ